MFANQVEFPRVPLFPPPMYPLMQFCTTSWMVLLNTLPTSLSLLHIRNDVSFKVFWARLIESLHVSEPKLARQRGFDDDQANTCSHDLSI